MVSVEPQVDAPVAPGVGVGAQGRMAPCPQVAPIAAGGAVVLLGVGGGIGVWVGNVDAAEAEVVALEDGVGLMPPGVSLLFGGDSSDLLRAYSIVQVIES